MPKRPPESPPVRPQRSLSEFFTARSPRKQTEASQADGELGAEEEPDLQNVVIVGSAKSDQEGDTSWTNSVPAVAASAFLEQYECRSGYPDLLILRPPGSIAVQLLCF